MPAIAIVEHKIPGRVRVRIASKRGNVSFFEAVVQKIRPHPRVHRVSASPHTGSVLIHHAGDVPEILSLAVDLFEVGESVEATKRLEAAANRSGLPLPEILDGAAVVAAGLGLYQLARRGDLGTASENFWAAFGCYRILHRPGLAAVFAGLGVMRLFQGKVLGSATSLLYYSLLAHQMADLEREKGGPIRQRPSRHVEPRAATGSLDPTAA
jgi:hypothetical protein